MAEISIIVPVYNKIRYLSAMLDSVLEQTFSDYEVVLIDDGSNDGSEKIADEYALRDSRVQVKHIKNGGVSHARNVGMDMANGEYITFIDSDDTIADSYLDNLYKCMVENDVDLVVSGVIKTDKLGNTLNEVYAPYEGKRTIEEIIDELADVQQKTGIYGTCVAKVFRRKLVEDLRFDEKLDLAEDFDFYIRLYDRIDSIYFDQHCLYYYLQSAENSSVLVSDWNIDYLSQILIQLRFKEFLEAHSAFSGKNKSIIENRIAEYCYCAIRFAEKERIHTVFQNVYKLYKQYDFSLNAKGFKKRIVLHLLKSGHEKTEILFVRLWDVVQKAIRRG